VDTLKLPRPLIVGSGNGLHVYWVLDNSVSIEIWRPIAKALLKACNEVGLVVDPQPTVDCSRVMRPVGVTNPKTNTPVCVLMDHPNTNFTRMQNILYEYVEEEVERTKNDDFDPSIYTAANTEKVVNGCEQIRRALTDPASISEPLWYGLVGVAAYCEDPEETACRWSSGHPNYSPESTIMKMQQWKQSVSGPATCSLFKKENPNGCRGCPFAGIISSPIQIGVQFADADIPEDTPDEDEQLFVLPNGYRWTTRGLCRTYQGVDIEIINRFIYPVGYGRDQALDYDVVKFCWDNPHEGWLDITLRQALLAEGNRDFSTALADQGILLSSKAKTEELQMFLRSYANKMKDANRGATSHNTMGWKDEGSRFIIGSSIFSREDGVVKEEHNRMISGNNKIYAAYHSKGDPSKWVITTQQLQRLQMNPQLFVLGVALSAPLYHFTGLKGLVVSLCGPTGGGKTLAQMWAQSLYGHPDSLHFKSKHTTNSLFTRLGIHSHLPMTIDEVTMMGQEEVGDFCYWVSQGQDKARLNRNAFEQEAKTWATPVIVSTNNPLHSKLIAYGESTDAQAARLLELHVEPCQALLKSPQVGATMYRIINENYGYVGHSFLKRIVQYKPEDIRAIIESHAKKVSAEYGVTFGGAERYWQTAIVLSHLAMSLANQWGLMSVDPGECVGWVVDSISGSRRNLKESRRSPMEVFSDYINQNVSHQIIVRKTGQGAPMVDLMNLPKGEIRVRIELFRTNNTSKFNSGYLYVNATHLKEWLASKSYTFDLIRDYMVSIGALEFSDNKLKTYRMYFGKGSSIHTAQTRALRFDLKAEGLRGMLDSLETEEAEGSKVIDIRSGAPMGS
jgi:hypothetical protein